MRSSGRGLWWSGRRERHVGGPGRDVDDGRRTWQSRAVFSADRTAPHKLTPKRGRLAQARTATVKHRAAVVIQRAASLSARPGARLPGESQPKRSSRARQQVEASLFWERGTGNRWLDAMITWERESACGYVGRASGRDLGVRAGHPAAAAPGAGLLPTPATRTASPWILLAKAGSERPPNTPNDLVAAHVALTKRQSPVRRPPNW